MLINYYISNMENDSAKKYYEYYEDDPTMKNEV